MLHGVDIVSNLLGNIPKLPLLLKVVNFQVVSFVVYELNFLILITQISNETDIFVGVVKVGGVDCDEEKSLPGQYNVRGFPTIKIFYNGKVKDYDGPRTARGLVDAAMKVAQEKVDSVLGGKSSSGGTELTISLMQYYSKFF